MKPYSVEIRDKGNGKIVYAKILYARSAILAKHFLIKELGIELTFNQYNITTTLLHEKVR